MTLTVRSATVTDATTKGSALTHAELDENFNHLRQSSNHSFTPSGSGAVATDMQSRGRLVVFAHDFMSTAQKAAVAARTATNVADAIQAAYDALPDDGGEIWLPPGGYYLTSAVTGTKANVVFRGFGGSHINDDASALFYSDQAIILFDFGSASATNHGGPHFINIGFSDSSGAGTCTGAVRLRRMNHARFDDVSVRDFTGGYAVLMDGTGDAIILPRFMGCKFRNNLIGLKSSGQLIGATLVGGYILGPGKTTAGSIGIDWNSSGADRLYVLGTGIEAYEIGVKIQGDSANIAGRFEDNATHVQVASGSGNYIAGSMFTGGTTGIDVDTTGAIAIGPNAWLATLPTTTIDIVGTNLGRYVNEPSLGEMDTWLATSNNTPIERVIRQTSTSNDRHAQFAAEDTGGAAKGVLRAGLNSSGAHRVYIGAETATTVEFIRNNTLAAFIATAGFGIGSNGTGIGTLTWGASSVADGGTVTHNNGSTPTAVFATGSVASEIVTVTAKGATTFTVAIKKDDGTAGTTQTVYWMALR
jgi:hypothetical protein